MWDSDFNKHYSKRSYPKCTLSWSSQKSILDMLPKKKKKSDTCESNNNLGQKFSSVSNQKSISNFVCQTNQNKSTDSSPDT